MNDTTCPACGRPMASTKEYCTKHDKVREPGTNCDLCDLDAATVTPVGDREKSDAFGFKATPVSLQAAIEAARKKA
jgi:hypothetical protein